MKIEQGGLFTQSGMVKGAQGEKVAHVNGEKTRGASKSIDGSNLAAAFDPIAQKKAKAQKQAMKVVGEAFAGDRAIDRDLEARREKIRQLQQENGADRQNIRDIEANREEFRKASGIAADSQEQKDLELLAKEKEASFAGSKISLSPDECKELDRIKKNGLTQYQQDSLAMKEDERYYAERISKAEQQIQTENAIITGTKLERLKTHTMVDAQKEAEQIQSAATKDIVNMLMDEAKEHVEEDLEEKREAAKEEAKEREEIQEKVDAAKEKRKEQEEFTEEILEQTGSQKAGPSGVSAAQQEIKDMMQKMKLVEDDIKGAAVDQTV